MAPQRQPVRSNPKTPAQIGEDMRQRHYRARVWLNENEYKQFARNVEKTGLSKETYLRQLIIGYNPKELPSVEYYNVLEQLTAISNYLSDIILKTETENNQNQSALSNMYSSLLKSIIFFQRHMEYYK